MTTESFSTTDGGLRPGALIDKRYQVIELLAEGGMGQVYRAEHVKLRRPVALKLLHPRVAGVGKFGKRFEREAVAAARLDHPNCVGVTDFGELEDGSHYLIMELVDGLTLMDLLDREDRLPLARALHIGVHILRGLEYAHQNGVVHRDVKPANIVLVDRDGDRDFARVVDFGIAKLSDGEDGAEKLTAAGDVFGSPTYMAPEQALGNAVDHRADVYAAAVVLFEMISGVPPFWGDDKLQVLARKTSNDPPRLAELCDVAVPAAIEEALQRALAREPAARIATAAELCSILEWQLEALGSRAPQVAPPPLQMPEHTPTPVPVALPRAETPVPMATPVPALPVVEPGRPRTGLYIGIGVVAVLLLALVLGILASRGDPDAFGDAPGEPQPAPPTRPQPQAKPPAKPQPKPQPKPEPVVAPAPEPTPPSSDADKAYADALKQLQKGRHCKDRKLAVARLKELGDKRAIPALTKARRRMSGGILGIGQENINACLTKDADAAIAYLKALP